MSKPEYWKNLNWANGWEKLPTRLAVTEQLGDSGSRKIINDSEEMLAMSGEEMSLVQSVDDMGDYHTAFLDNECELFRRISNYLQVNAQARTLAPPTGERTRMVRAQKAVDEALEKGVDNLTDSEVLVLKTNLRTLLEDLKYIKTEYGKLYTDYGIPRVKTKPPQSGSVRITKIRVIKHENLWQRYEGARSRINQDIQDSADLTNRVNQEMAQTKVPYHKEPARALTTGGKVYGRNPVVFTTESDVGLTASSTANLPVLNSEIGEVLLMHGTLPKVIKIIVDKGFDPNFNEGTTKGSVTKYGALGQGTYFGDSFAKVQTYTGCPLCHALRCDCVDGSGEPVDRMLILARCLLGVPTKARTHDSHRQENTSTIKPQKHSVIGQERGILKSWTFFGSNEFLLKEADQMYPEFVIYWHRV
jgi:hypothetical protein